MLQVQQASALLQAGRPEHPGVVGGATSPASTSLAPACPKDCTSGAFFHLSTKVQQTKRTPATVCFYRDVPVLCADTARDSQDRPRAQDRDVTPAPAGRTCQVAQQALRRVSQSGCCWTLQKKQRKEKHRERGNQVENQKMRDANSRGRKVLSGPHLQRSSQAGSGHAQDGAQTVQLCCPCYDSFLPRHEALLASFTPIQTGRPKVLGSPTSCSGEPGTSATPPAGLT